MRSDKTRESRPQIFIGEPEERTNHSQESEMIEYGHTLNVSKDEFLMACIVHEISKAGKSEANFILTIWMDKCSAEFLHRSCAARFNKPDGAISFGWG